MKTWDDFYDAVDTIERDNPVPLNPDHPKEEWEYAEPKKSGDWILVKQKGDKSVFLLKKLEDGSEFGWIMNSYWEKNCYNSVAQDATGKILMAGLGVGYEAFILDSKESVESMTIVECDEDIITLSTPVLANCGKVTIVPDYILHFLETTVEKFDVIYFDIFPASMIEFPDEVEILVKEAQKKLNPNGKIMFWKQFKPVRL